MTDVILNWHLVNPRSLIRRHCIYDVRDLFTINIIKCKLLTSRKTATSKRAFMKNEVVPFSQKFDFGISCKSQLAICFSVLCVQDNNNLSPPLCIQACPEITSKSNWLSNRPPNRFNDPLQAYARFLTKSTVLCNKCSSLKRKRVRTQVIKKRWINCRPSPIYKEKGHV